MLLCNFVFLSLLSHLLLLPPFFVNLLHISFPKWDWFVYLWFLPIGTIVMTEIVFFFLSHVSLNTVKKKRMKKNQKQEIISSKRNNHQKQARMNKMKKERSSGQKSMGKRQKIVTRTNLEMPNGLAKSTKTPSWYLNDYLIDDFYGFGHCLVCVRTAYCIHCCAMNRFVHRFDSTVVSNVICRFKKNVFLSSAPAYLSNQPPWSRKLNNDNNAHRKHIFRFADQLPFFPFSESIK